MTTAFAAPGRPSALFRQDSVLELVRLKRLTAVEQRLSIVIDWRRRSSGLAGHATMPEGLSPASASLNSPSSRQPASPQRLGQVSLPPPMLVGHWSANAVYFADDSNARMALACRERMFVAAPSPICSRSKQKLMTEGLNMLGWFAS